MHVAKVMKRLWLVGTGHNSLPGGASPASHNLECTQKIKDDQFFLSNNFNLLRLFY